MKKVLSVILSVGFLTFNLSAAYAATPAATTDLTLQDALNKVTASGYSHVEQIKQTQGHYEIQAETTSGQVVDIKMDKNGKIYKVEEPSHLAW